MMMTVTLNPHHWRIASTARIVVALANFPSSAAVIEIEQSIYLSMYDEELI
jgi:hypothetical protein